MRIYCECTHRTPLVDTKFWVCDSCDAVYTQEKPAAPGPDAPELARLLVPEEALLDLLDLFQDTVEGNAFCSIGDFEAAEEALELDTQPTKALRELQYVLGMYGRTPPPGGEIAEATKRINAYERDAYENGLESFDQEDLYTRGYFDGQKNVCLQVLQALNENTTHESLRTALLQLLDRLNKEMEEER